jgi:hypothetical protein
MDDEAEIISYNLVQFLRGVIREGQEAEIAIHKELRQVRVYVDDDVVLACTFDDLLGGPGVSLN